MKRLASRLTWWHMLSVDDITPVERNRFAVEGVGPDRSAVRGPESRPSS